MSTFTDSMGDTWSIQFDGLLLDEVFEKTNVDLADISAGGLAAIESDPKALVKVLVVLCADELSSRGKTARDLSKRIVGEAIERASAAVVGAAAAFFPPRHWSEVESRLKQQREFNDQWATMRPLVAKLNQPDFPSAMKDAVMAAIAEGINEMTPAGTSPKSPVNQSATGPDVTPPTLAPNVLANAGLALATD